MTLTSVPPFVRRPTADDAPVVVTARLPRVGAGAPDGATAPVLPSTTAVVAAHLRALALLAGEDEICWEQSDPGADAVRLRTLDTAGSWRRLRERVGPLPERVRVRTADLALDVDTAAGTLTAEAAPAVADAERLHHHLDRIVLALRLATADPDADVADDPLVTPAERDLLVELGTGERLDPLPGSLFERFEQHAADTPDRTAVIHRSSAVSYGRLAAAARLVHRALTRTGVAPGDVVAVQLDRGPLWIAVVLGVLRAGAVFLPVATDDPAARREELLRLSRARAVVTDAADLGLVADPVDVLRDPTPDGSAPPVRVCGPLDPAYVYFTSGSTGAPKGALCGHGGMTNHLWAKIRDLALTADDVVLQSARSTFDISLWQFAAPLVVGATVLVVDQPDLLDVPVALDLLVAHRVSVAQFVPSYLAVLLDHLTAAAVDEQRGDAEADGAATAADRLRSLTRLSVTGEAISIPVVQRTFAVLPWVTVVNAYGATEASDDTTHEILHGPPQGPSVPVGRPNINVGVHVLDGRLRPVPPGAVGEIAFSGVMVGLGYLHDPERTAAAFVDDPELPGRRLYRSGDWGRWLPEGTLQFHGRRDEQVKIAGIRLELGEIEHHLRALDGVGEAAVVTVPTGGAKELAGFWTGQDGGAATPDATAVGRALAVVLPAAAVPTTLLPVPALPLTDNGKVDKKRLTRWALDHRAGSAEQDPDPGATAALAGGAAGVVARAFAAALEVPVTTLGPDSDFFALGGTSLRALRAVAASGRAFGIAELFRHPVLGELAAVLDGAHRRSDAVLVPLGNARDAIARLLVLPPPGATASFAASLAGALADPAGGPVVEVRALQHPGHDLPPTAALPEHGALVARIADELAADHAADPHGGPLLVWGHGASAGTAVAVLRGLLDRGVPVAGLLLAAQPARTARGVTRRIGVLAATPDAELAATVAAELGADLSGASDEALAVLGRLHRSAAADGELVLLDAGLGLDGDGVAADPLPVPVVLLGALDDPAQDAARGTAPSGAWADAAADVSSVLLPDGGPLFPVTRPERTAAAVRSVLAGVPVGALP